MRKSVTPRTRFFQQSHTLARLALFFGLALVTALPAIGCRRAEPVWPATGKLRVLTSFAPLYCFAKNVAGDDADVRCLLTVTGPHDYHPDHKDVQLVRRADLLFIVGLELDEFVTRLAGSSGSAKVVKVGDALPHDALLHLEEGHDHGHAHHGHSHGEHDPHVWLSPDLAKKMVDIIALKLGQADPDHKDAYHERAKAYGDVLLGLKKEGEAAFAGKKNRRLISTHESLGYFAEAFKLEVVDSIQPRPGIEADAKTMSRLKALCKQKEVSVITVEPQFSTGPAETLQRQLAKDGVKVSLVEVDPMETAPLAAGGTEPDPKYFVERMRQNLLNLAKALP